MIITLTISRATLLDMALNQLTAKSFGTEDLLHHILVNIQDDRDCNCSKRRGWWKMFKNVVDWRIIGARSAIRAMGFERCCTAVHTNETTQYRIYHPFRFIIRVEVPTTFTD
jgi:hypothetical protein